ncbi:hypothetical protein OSTOST_19672, partial [Ostertagia ostertagi]
MARRLLISSFRPPIEFKDPNAFRYRIADDGERELSGTKGQVNYTYTFDYDLQRLEEYKVTLFAEDDHYCHTDDATTYFNTSAIEPMLPPRAITRTSSSSLERISETQSIPQKFNTTAAWHSILETNILYRQPIEFRTPQTEEEWLIPSDDVSVGGVIGEGAFGLVCKGTMSGPKGMAVRVAIKQLKTNAIDEEREEFLREMDIMKQVGRHPNIVTMYGLCEEPDFQCMVMEYVPFGDLKHYLQNLRKQVSSVLSRIS